LSVTLFSEAGLDRWAAKSFEAESCKKVKIDFFLAQKKQKIKSAKESLQKNSFKKSFFSLLAQLT
jgi:hypothetical protein